MLRKILIAALTVSAITVASPAGATARSVQCIAHRGGVSSHTAETVPTYSGALDAGVPEVEGDVWFTATGVPMMSHDNSLALFGAEDLKVTDLGYGQIKTHISDTGDTMASVYEVRVLIAAHPSQRFQMEIKQPNLTAAQWDALDGRLNPIRNQLTITSFSLTAIRQAQDRGYHTGWLMVNDTNSTASSTVVEDFSNISAAHVAALAKVGVATQAYTPDDRADWTRLAGYGVTALVTDLPLDCMSWNAERTGRALVTHGHKR